MSEIPVPSAPPVDPAEIGRVLWRRKWLLIGPWLAAVAIGVHMLEHFR